MERQYKVETREVDYKGEKYQIETTLYYFPDDPENTYTTTESDMKWWEDLRTQYITRHPEALESFSETFPEDKVYEDSPGIWIATWESPSVTVTGKTKEEAIRNLYVWLSV